MSFHSRASQGLWFTNVLWEFPTELVFFFFFKLILEVSFREVSLSQIFCGSYPGKPILKKTKPTEIILEWAVFRRED